MAKKTNKIWRTGDFFIQLATVVIGILITFGGNALIRKSSERKETVHILSMVKDELEKNLTRVESQKKLLVHEYAGTVAMKPYMYAPGLIPADSLDKYISVLTRTINYGFLTNSFEVLKSSPQIQTVRNKELLRDLFMAYENINNFRGDMLSYNSLKERGMAEYLTSLDSDMYDAMFKAKEGAYIIFADITKNTLIRNYIVSTANGNNVSYLIPGADGLAAEIARVIGMINKEVGRR